MSGADSDVGQRTLVHDIYCPASLAQAAEDYQAHLLIRVLRSGECETVIAFTGPNGENASEELVREFLNYLLDLSVRSVLGAA